jgi:putative DNA primase/helicase
MENQQNAFRVQEGCDQMAYNFFKGYVPTKDKKCLLKFKNKTAADLQTYEQVKNLPEFAGILNDETILIDIDDLEQSEILFNIVKDLNLKCRVYKTSRGKHFLFKNNLVETNKIHTKLAVGLEADIKIGTRNSYSILKFNNKEREILYDTDEYELLPKWLIPIKTPYDFLNMEDGDGRNQTFFNYILILQSNDFSEDEAKLTIRLINQYVLSEPLKEKELETILRHDAFKKPVFVKNGKFLFDKFAIYIKNNNHIVRINNQLHIYHDGIYIEGQSEIEAAMIEHIPDLTRAKRSEVLSYLDVLIRKNVKTADAHLIAFKNGIYNIETSELLEFSPEYIITNKINYNYNPNAYSELADKTFNRLACNDKSIRLLLEEAIGYCFYRRNELRKSFILTGDKKNGKSTFLAMLKELLGDDNTAALDLGELADRFSSASLFGKLANIGDDIGDEFIANPAIFKKIVSGDRIKGENKGQKEFFFNPYCKLLFSANNIPRIKDKSGAVLDRLVIIPFDARFSKSDPDFDPYIKYKLIQEDSMEYLVLLGIEGLKRVLHNQAFTKSQKVTQSIEEYEEINNPILLFFKEIDIDEIVNEPTKEVYQKYNEFCLANSFNPMSNIEFSKQIKRRFDLEIINKTIKGIKYRIFSQKEK